MILNSLKHKSVKRQIKKLLSNYKTIKTSKYLIDVLVLVDVDKFKDIEALQQFSKALGIQDYHLTIIGFSNSKQKLKTSKELLFAQSKLGWKGVIKDAEIKAVLQKPYHLVINYFNSNHIGLSLLSANTTTAFRIGFPNANPKLNDLIINCNISEIDMFTKEMVKYLNLIKTA